MSFLKNLSLLHQHVGSKLPTQLVSALHPGSIAAGPMHIEGVVYASQADILNVALFGVTAKQWRDANPELKGNIRDYASAEQLLVLVNLENLNAHFIKEGLSPDERLHKLNEVAIYQMQLLSDPKTIQALKQLPGEI